MKRFSIMLTVAAVVGCGIAFCFIGLAAGQPNEVLSTYTAVGAGLGLLGSLLYQAVKPVS